MRVAVTIPTGAVGLSEAVDLGSGRMVGLEMSAVWVAAAISVQVSIDGTNYFNLYNDGGTQFSLTTDAARIVAMRSDARSILAPFRYVKLRSGLTGAVVDQTSDRAVFIYCEARP